MCPFIMCLALWILTHVKYTVLIKESNFSLKVKWRSIFWAAILKGTLCCKTGNKEMDRLYRQVGWVPFSFFFLIYCKLGVVCTLHDEPVLVSTCCCALSLQCIYDTGTDRRDSFTPALHCKHCNLVVFQASRHEDTNHEACSPLYYTQSFQTSGWRDHPY